MSIAIAVVVAVIVAVAVSLSSRQDGPSYDAGAELGARYARQFSMVSADPLSNSILRDACESFGRYEEYEQFDTEDFVKGCVDGARTVAPG